VRQLSFATGVIGGTLAALAAQIYLADMHVELASAWRDLFIAWSAQFKSALAWWLVAGTALIFGYIAAALTRFLMLHYVGRRRRRACGRKPRGRPARHAHRDARRGLRGARLTVTR
jgi:hypothetical protein